MKKVGILLAFLILAFTTTVKSQEITQQQLDDIVQIAAIANTLSDFAPVDYITASFSDNTIVESKQWQEDANSVYKGWLKWNGFIIQSHMSLFNRSQEVWDRAVEAFYIARYGSPGMH